MRPFPQARALPSPGRFPLLGAAVSSLKILPWQAAAALLAATACSSGVGTMTAVIRPAESTPARFEPELADLRIAGDTIAGAGCRSPMKDPRDGTVIVFLRSTTMVGDYHVPSGRYGVGPDELLRIECNTGRVLGIVRR
jgi:hypothetical protein